MNGIHYENAIPTRVRDIELVEGILCKKALLGDQIVAIVCVERSETDRHLKVVVRVRFFRSLSKQFVLGNRDFSLEK